MSTPSQTLGKVFRSCRRIGTAVLLTMTAFGCGGGTPTTPSDLSFIPVEYRQYAPAGKQVLTATRVSITGSTSTSKSPCWVAVAGTTNSRLFSLDPTLRQSDNGRRRALTRNSLIGRGRLPD